MLIRLGLGHLTSYKLKGMPHLMLIKNSLTSAQLAITILTSEERREEEGIMRGVAIPSNYSLLPQFLAAQALNQVLPNNYEKPPMPTICCPGGSVLQTAHSTQVLTKNNLYSYTPISPFTHLKFCCFKFCSEHFSFWSNKDCSFFIFYLIFL